MDNKSDELYIPSNIKTRLEFFKGFGVKETVITLIVMAISLPFAYLIYMLSGTLLAVIFIFIMVAGTVISITKDDNNLCVARQIKIIIKNLNMQKKYKYVFYDKWKN